MRTFGSETTGRPGGAPGELILADLVRGERGGPRGAAEERGEIGDPAAEFARLLASEGPEAQPDENTVLAPPTTTTIRRGDVFQLGRHRLACGDATSATDVARLLAGANPCLMVTDPPYGVNYQPAFRHQAYPRQRTAVGRVTNDTQADWAAAYALFPGDVAYVWHAALYADVVMAGLRQAQLEVRSQIIWAKPTFVLGRGASGNTNRRGSPSGRAAPPRGTAAGRRAPCGRCPT